MLNTFPPDLSYVASSRLLTKLRRMRGMIPLRNSSAAIWFYWATLMEVITSNLSSHEADRPDYVNVLDNNRIFSQRAPLDGTFRMYGPQANFG